jgi:hypothetical protein
LAVGRFQRAPERLDVLLRHRPLSIAPRSPGEQRHGFQEKSGSYRVPALPPLEVPVPT